MTRTRSLKRTNVTHAGKTYAVSTILTTKGP